LRDLPILLKLLEQARRRVLTQLAMEKGIVALIVALGGAVLLLLAGTQLLDWYWIALLVVASLGAGLYQLRGRIPGLYEVAQRIDRRLGLADALSTAFHFARHPDPYREIICERQAQDANETARGVDVSAAVPYSRPKYLIPVVVLLAAAVGLFAVRYLVTGSLSLEPSLVRIALDSFFGGSPKVAKNVSKQGAFKPEPFDPGAPDAAQKGDEQKKEDEINNAIDQPDNAAADDSQAAGDQKQDGATPGQDAKQSDQDKQGADGKQSDQQSKSQDGKQDSKQDSNNQNSKQGQDKQGNMFDKLRDALANMMKGNKSNDSQQQQSKQGGQKSDQQSQQQDGSQEGQSQGQQQEQAANGSQQTGEGKQDQNGSDAKSNQKTGEKASADAKSGIGSADGDKKAREAAMLEAMGKIEEIIGKRQQNVTGEMIEVGSTKQQLKTPFLQKQGEHAEAGGEIHRDEVPPMYQQFVEQYFEEIRKPAGGSGNGSAKAAAKGAASNAAPADGAGKAAVPVPVPGSNTPKP
jgi:hypothetical protein